MRTTRRVTGATAIAAMLLAIAGCGSDAAKSSEPSTSAGAAQTSIATTSPSNSGDGAGDSASSNQPASGSVGSAGSDGDVVDALGAGDALDAVGIGGVAFALATALKADRHELDGNTIHLYLGEQSSLRGETACIVTDSILSEGQFAVIHDDGQEFVC